MLPTDEEEVLIRQAWAKHRENPASQLTDP